MIESHISIRQEERYHLPQRRTFSILKPQHPSLNDNHVLRFALKGINGTMNPNGLVTSLLVFGVARSFPSPNKHSLYQTERFQALKKARPEMETIVADQRIVDH